MRGPWFSNSHHGGATNQTRIHMSRPSTASFRDQDVVRGEGLHRDFHLGNTLCRVMLLSPGWPTGQRPRGDRPISTWHTPARTWPCCTRPADAKTLRNACVRQCGRLDPDPHAARFWMVSDVLVQALVQAQAVQIARRSWSRIRGPARAGPRRRHRRSAATLDQTSQFHRFPDDPVWSRSACHEPIRGSLRVVSATSTPSIRPVRPLPCGD